MSGSGTTFSRSEPEPQQIITVPQHCTLPRYYRPMSIFNKNSAPDLVAALNGTEGLDVAVCGLCVPHQVPLLVETQPALLARVLPHLQVHPLHMPQVLDTEHRQNSLGAPAPRAAGAGY
jgi:hypothetical protein